MANRMLAYMHLPTFRLLNTVLEEESLDGWLATIHKVGFHCGR